jgi:2-iminobutanoate/2-iminopropanoate deaminase
VTSHTAVRTDQAPAPVQGAPYSQAVVAGDLVFVSGQVPLDPSGSPVGGSITDQTRQVFANLAAILGAAGSGLDRIVRTTVYLADLDDFQEMNGAYAAFFTADPPARTTFEVSRLPAGARVEIDCIALRGT